MTKDKDFKRLVRARMHKTGESYSAARAQLIKRYPLLPEDYKRLAGMSDAALMKRTRRTWPEWVRALDDVDAAAWSHRDIARHVSEQYPDVTDWWAQTITVGYERLRGLRDMGQRRGGLFDISKSRTFPVAVARLHRAWRDDGIRGTWLDAPGWNLRTEKEGLSMRADWGDGTAVDVYFTDVSKVKSRVMVQHRKLPDRSAAEEAKVSWGARLDRLGAQLSGGSE